MRIEVWKNPFLASYIETALWSSTDDNGDPLDSLDIIELADETIERMQKDCDEFQKRMADANIEVDGHIAHDFWLTRNHHGAGFWDGDYPEPQATQLTALAHMFGECDLYVGDDNKLYLS